jgi:phage terminase Nu1 subunit (DNA packaging protein)
VSASFNTAEVAKWLQTRARDEGAGTSQADEAELKRRKLAAETAKAELELAKAMGLVAPIREFERSQAAVMAAIRANMRNVPGRAVLQLLGCTDEMVFKSKLMAEIDLALVTASETEPDIDEDEPEDE